ncbi:MAG TPA: hypothetical protein VF813_07110, partial [Anaerolineaceae bacterium]
MGEPPRLETPEFKITRTLTPTITPSPTPTSALANLVRSVDRQTIGFGMILVCGIGLAAVGLTLFRGKLF